MEIPLLGGLSVQLAARTLHLGTPKQQAVLSMFAVQPGQLVTVHDLVDELWPDGPPRSAVANVRTYVANLRRTFEAFEGGPGVIVRRQTGYRLVLRPECIDVFQFESGALCRPASPDDRPPGPRPGTTGACRGALAGGQCSPVFRSDPCSPHAWWRPTSAAGRCGRSGVRPVRRQHPGAAVSATPLLPSAVVPHR
ncbi:winged helix-turn-helix domain-containing protein [Micromonospora sp. NPDC005203]|uniref:AfsR/SARP family transcriptional regulator n=1 Tax=Micromonospora sp. NPDC005203 TaxID=3364226 RepID=UPI0036A5DBA7